MNRDTLRINEPCHADWSEMNGDEKKRFCSACSKHVHDLSEMTEPQATAVLATVEEPCVRYTANSDGTVRFKPSRRVFLARAGMVAGGLLIGGTAAAAVLPSASVDSCGEQSLLEKISDAFWSMFEEGPEMILGEVEATAPPPEPLEVMMGKLPPEEHGEDAVPPAKEEEEALQPQMGRLASAHDAG
ncbi:MAG: hypothetical protein P8R54_22805 [Myxococcota bacterium]|nr:hypothetical protein [Myxococcota bacterium]